MGGKGIEAGAGEPCVSVVIPTFERPWTLLRAVRSVLAQTLERIEVIVVVDGRDRETLQALESIRDPRLRTLVPNRHLGNADARNVAVDHVRAPWVAFVDDDDEWMPEKLAAQLRVAERSAHRHPIVSCRMIGRNEFGDFIWPRRYPRQGEPLSEYLFCRSTPFAGDGILQTSTILTATRLLRHVRFASGLRRYVDLDWLLRADAVDGVGVEFVPEPDPLSVWHMEHGRARISAAGDGAFTLAWARERRALFTPRAYASFVMTIGSKNSALARDWSAFFPIGVEAYRHGSPRTIDLISHVAYFVLPDQLQGRLAAAYSRRTRGRPSNPADDTLSRPHRDSRRRAAVRTGEKGGPRG
jgi:glycosyltransferase involved in cell wall biosynthesis